MPRNETGRRKSELERKEFVLRLQRREEMKIREWAGRLVKKGKSEFWEKSFYECEEKKWVDIGLEEKTDLPTQDGWLKNACEAVKERRQEGWLIKKGNGGCWRKRL